MNPHPPDPTAPDLRRRFLVTGATGLLGGWVADELRRGGGDVVAVGGPGGGGVDLAAAGAAAALLERARPAVVVHTAALAAIADAARDPGRARAVNVEATASLARACDAIAARLVHVSTDLVFDGEAPPYGEDAPPCPLSIYGTTKLESERAALAAADAIVVRVSLLFGPTRTARRGFFDELVGALRAGRSVTLFDDEWRTPLSLRAAAEALVAVGRSSVRGLLHLGGPERLSRHAMGLALAEALGVDAGPIARASRTSVPGEPRPRDVSLDRSRFEATFPSLASASFADECRRMLG